MERLNIVIDGSTGFIGANLSEHFLNLGHNVSILMRKGSNAWRLKRIKNEISIYNVDIIDRDRIFEAIQKIKPEVFIHTAAHGGYHFEKEKTPIFNANLFGTMNVLDASIAAEVPFFINTGSSSEYGLKKKPMKETDELNPETNYAISKALATQYCTFKSNTFTKNVTFRLFSAYGYYEEKHRLIPYVLYSAIKRQHMYLSSPSNVRDFIFIEDILKAYSTAIKSSRNLDSGSIFNIGSGKQSTTSDIVKAVKSIMKTNINVSFDKSSKREGDKATVWQADITKISSALKWKPKYGIVEGLLKTKNWLEQNINLYEDKENDKYQKHQR